ncbi:orotidine-5'-phosphate decarboxylase [Candidatus Berkelbacteria bacterium]|nr:orotidine-5'-phosphate decarboxylase [Candidatus Berkelbacteria bacterium]
MANEPRIIVALDGVGRQEAFDLTRQLASIPGVWGVKVNSLLRKEGYGLIDVLHGLGVRVMADLKLPDIPNTVRNDCEFLRPHQPEIVTVHASGGAEMVRAAVETLGEASQVIAITVLTSLGVGDCVRIYRRRPEHAVTMLAWEALGGGAAGIVCSPQELRQLNQLPQEVRALRRITPGIRPADAPADDQARTMTASEAIAAGANLIVIGRPIVKAPDPVEAAERFAREVEETLTSMAVTG